MGIKEENDAWQRDSCHEGPSLFVKNLREKGFRETQIKVILLEIDNICKSCWDSNFRCMCWNDD